MLAGQGRKKALFKNLILSLVEHGQIKTTEARAKAVRRLLEKLVSLAKKGTLQARRKVISFLPEKAANKLVDQIAPKLAQRTSGFTRLVKLGKRTGDGALMVKMEFVEFPEALGSLKPFEPKKRRKEVKKQEK